MRMPLLLQKGTMDAVGRFSPLTMSINLKAEPPSSATMTLHKDDISVSVSDWVQVFAPNGEMFVAVVRSVQTDYFTGIRTVNMEHTFSLLSDDVIIGKTTFSETQNIKTVISSLLSHQSHNYWDDGQVDFTAGQPWEFNNTDILSALDTLTDSVQDWTWTFDQTTLPWRVNLVRMPTVPTCEMRLTRNMTGMTVNVDKSGMYTRVYPVGKSNMMIDKTLPDGTVVHYLERNVDRYGVISKVLTDQSYRDKTSLENYGAAQLRRNCTPIVTISIKGVLLSELTGEPLDSLKINTVCRVPLPDYGDTFDERITELSWADCIKDEMSVQVSLANERQTMTNIIKKQSSATKKARTTSGCHLEEDEKHVE